MVHVRRIFHANDASSGWIRPESSTMILSPSSSPACMARGSGIRRRSRRMRRGAKMCAAKGAVMDPHGGAVLKVSSTDSKVDKPSSACSPGEDWIYVRGHRIETAGLHFDSHGNVFVPDSEDEESGMEDQACGPDISAGTELDMDLTPKVHDEAADQAAHKDLPVHEPLVLGAVEDSRMKVPTEVPEQLKEVLANMDPIYHDVFVSMYKILVPIWFRSFHC